MLRQATLPNMSSVSARNNSGAEMDLAKDLAENGCMEFQLTLDG
jgi:hypothetical protein